MGQKLSVTMALDTLAQQCAHVAELEQRTREARAERDDLIRAARAGDVPYSTLSTITLLERQQLSKIVATNRNAYAHRRDGVVQA